MTLKLLSKTRKNDKLKQPNLPKEGRESLGDVCKFIVTHLNIDWRKFNTLFLLRGQATGK